MNDLRTEADLRAALNDLADDAPDVVVVLPRTAARPHDYRGRLRWLAPLAAAVVVAAVAIGIASHGSRDTQTGTARDLHGLGGHPWQLSSINGRPAAEGFDLHIEPNGRFSQEVGLCTNLIGHVTVTSAALRTDHVRLDPGLCIAIPKQTSDQAATRKTLQTLFASTVSWSHDRRGLTLSKPKVGTLLYTRAPLHTRQWTYHGVGIVLPASWPKNALRCATPIKNTVIYPTAAVATCAYLRPAGVTSVTFSPDDPKFDPLASVPGEPVTIHIQGVQATLRNGVPTSGPDRGLEVAEVRVPSRNATVVVASPSHPATSSHAVTAAHAMNLFIVGSCPIPC